jgi:hypothetical protein
VLGRKGSVEWALLPAAFDFDLGYLAFSGGWALVRQAVRSSRARMPAPHNPCNTTPPSRNQQQLPRSLPAFQIAVGLLCLSQRIGMRDS